ncbi:hypothetical protein EVAR_19148_1 [Eumeta japonica]|uniref:Uncharacterized protein n=1 Tax=Eumeta variegata TaxID=151549 RepID=A0A4C1VMX4_EUMVA|nr:hypothetical protein EVAR_19148_1 [Eumeta japonica]
MLETDDRSARIALENSMEPNCWHIKSNQILSTRNLRACMKRLTDVSEAREQEDWTTGSFTHWTEATLEAVTSLFAEKVWYLIGRTGTFRAAAKLTMRWPQLYHITLKFCAPSCALPVWSPQRKAQDPEK